MKWELPLPQCESGNHSESDRGGEYLLHAFHFSSEVGETPLHKAAETSSVAVVKLLLDEGAEVNPKTDAKVKLNRNNLYYIARIFRGA